MKEIRLSGTVMDNDSADIMRFFGYSDVCCPKDITDALKDADGDDIALIIDSGGGMLIAGHQMYCELRNYKGNKTARIQSIAASAATIPIMACSKRIAEPVSLICIHNPMTYTIGDVNAHMKSAAELETFKSSILNAYENVLAISRDEISALMDEDKFLDASKALEYGIINEMAQPSAEPANIIAMKTNYKFPTAEMRNIFNSEKTAKTTLNNKLEIEKLRTQILERI